MGILALVILGIGLSFDTFAVSVSCGLIENRIRFLQATRIAIIFAIFQALMPVLGWFLGLSIKNYIVQIDHWIAFSLLSLIGIKMIYESISDKAEKNINPRDIKVILMFAIATTIDALAVGITFAFLNVKLIRAALIIGIITYIVSMLGILFGKKAGKHFGNKIEIAGGIILIAIGVKILVEHLVK
jgi:manganese efflux pump family protein